MAKCKKHFVAECPGCSDVSWAGAFGWAAFVGLLILWALI